MQPCRAAWCLNHLISISFLMIYLKRKDLFSLPDAGGGGEKGKVARLYVSFHPLPSWPWQYGLSTSACLISLVLINTCFKLLVNKTEHRYECVIKRWEKRIPSLSSDCICSNTLPTHTFPVVFADIWRCTSGNMSTHNMHIIGYTW